MKFHRKLYTFQEWMCNSLKAAFCGFPGDTVNAKEPARVLAIGFIPPFSRSDTQIAVLRAETFGVRLAFARGPRTFPRRVRTDPASRSRGLPRERKKAFPTRSTSSDLFALPRC